MDTEVHRGYGDLFWASLAVKAFMALGNVDVIEIFSLYTDNTLILITYRIGTEP